MATPAEELDVDGTAVRLSNPDKIYFPRLGAEGGTKRHLVEYYRTIATLDGNPLVPALATGPPTSSASRTGSRARRSIRSGYRPRSPHTCSPAASPSPPGGTRRPARHQSRGYRMGRQPRVRHLPPLARDLLRRRAPGPAARRPGPPARDRVPRCRRRRGRRRPPAARRARLTPGTPRRAADEASTSSSRSSRAGPSPRSAVPRSRWPARSSAGPAAG